MHGINFRRRVNSIERFMYYNILYYLMKKFIRTIRKSGTSFAINIPPEIIKILNLKEGDIIEVEIKKAK